MQKHGSVIVLDQVVGADRPFVLEAYWHPREDYCSTKSKSLKFHDVEIWYADPGDGRTELRSGRKSQSGLWRWRGSSAPRNLPRPVLLRPSIFSCRARRSCEHRGSDRVFS